MARKQQLGWIAAATVIGTTIEWFDFFIYGTAAALVFNRTVFPSFDQTAATLASFSTFAVGLLVRPLGAAIVGHFGDRVGRKSMLMFTLLLMGAPTVLIGFVPTYNQVGLWAAIILVVLRVLQGIALGGEWGGAVLMAVEHAPAGERAFYGSMPQLGVPLGLICSTGVFASLSGLSEADFLSWGWRVPFLFSIVLVAFGLVARKKIAESPEFQHAKATDRMVRMPAIEVIKSNPVPLLLTMGGKMGEVTLFYLFTVFLLSFATSKLGMPRGDVLLSVMIGAGVGIIMIPVFGKLSDGFGARRIYAWGSLLLAICAVPLFMLVEIRSFASVTAAAALALGVLYPFTYGAQAALYSAQFPAELRYSGISLGVQMAAAVGGGLAPFVATTLLATQQSSMAVALYLAAMALLATFCTLKMRETVGHGAIVRDLTDHQGAQLRSGTGS